MLIGVRLTVEIQHPKGWDIGLHVLKLFLPFLLVQNYLEAVREEYRK